MKRSPLLRLLLSVPFVVVAVVVFIGGSECADTVAATTAVAVTAATNAPTDTVLMDGETVEGIPGYCAWEPDYSCYAVGLPACCFNGVDQCPTELPDCEIEAADTEATNAPTDTAATNAPTATGDIMVGTSYCTWGPDTTCYANGWPACCTNGEECPTEPPGCEIEAADTAATNAPTDTEASNAPNTTGNIMVGTSYWTWSPDTTCYVNGLPACCTNGEEVGETSWTVISTCCSS
ncbi:hypothetical protein ACHAWU_006716 [Discostella pseudostelligera]|uniref:Uncharacterized protein n=1 Tax=Discostella pseudostelligera TaxID=259834 RepID=A0ABD3MWL4_9STRA